MSALTIGVLAFAYIAIAVCTQMYVRTKALPHIDADEDKLERFESRILTDLKLLADQPVYTASPREKNAERFLSGFISWSGAEPLQTIEHDRLIESMSRHLDALKSEASWQAFVKDELIYELDLAWVDQLIAYDSLDLSTHPRVLESIAKAETSRGLVRVSLMAELPFPQLSELRFATLVRAVQLAHVDQPREAMEIYHHVGHLVATTDSLIGAMTSVQMLQNEKSIAKNFGVTWALVDDEKIEAMKRTSWAWPSIVRLRARTGSMGIFEPFVSRSTSSCTWVYEPSLELVISDYLLPTFVFEPNMTERIERQRGVINKALESCGHSELQAFYTPSASPLMVGRGIPNPARIPFLRRVIGLNLVAASTANFFKMYEEPPRHPASD